MTARCSWSGGAGRPGQLAGFLALAEALGQADRTALIERLVLRALPRARRDQALKELLEVRPESVPYLQANLQAG